MGTISVSLPTDGTTADVADVNTPINTIVNEFNGNIDNANIKSAAAIAGSKLADASIDIGTKASAWDGWVPVSDSWTYASATTITVPSDATTKYSVGDKIKIVQSATTKYFYITSLTSTILTVSGGSDYTVANSAISGIYYSKAETPLNFPTDFSWTPTTANLSGGTLNFAKFSMHGRQISYRLKYTLAGAGVAGSVTFTLPVNAHADYANANEILNANGSLFDANGALHNVIVRWASASTFTILADNTSGSYGQSSALSSTVPFTWASGDFISVNGSYGAA